MKYLLGVLGSKHSVLETVEGVTRMNRDYSIKLEVSQDVIDWLNNHDLEIDYDGKKVYVCNSVKYVFIGPKIEPNKEEYGKVN